MLLERILESKLGANHYHRKLLAKGYDLIKDHSDRKSYRNKDTGHEVVLTHDTDGKVLNAHVIKHHKFSDVESAMKEI